ncbi:PP2C family protein-serine/threonine phosphatase [Streptomyces sp. NPDC056309]|uniref:PP2C family protein-serine/threonine phosphatase n=1 Tax=unclassified Streptomyces TaxID=2593676 RepID=UPI0035E00709
MDLRRSPSGRVLVVIPLVLIAVVGVVDALSPPDVHLGPLLVAAPAFTAAFSGPWLTALIGVLAAGTELFIGGVQGTLGTQNLQAQVASLIIVSGLIVVYCLFRDQREHQLTQSRVVAQAVQDVLFPPLPERSGPLRLACLYLAAQDEATMGGDLYAAARTGHSTRLLIADVRGKGLPAISHAALLLGAFRAAAHRRPSLPRLAVHLDGAMRWEFRQWQTAQMLDTDESFATALLVDIPDSEPVLHLLNCGHPSPLLIGAETADPLTAQVVAPPLGLGELSEAVDYMVASFPFLPGDTLLLHTDGVLEARNARGDFYPLADRAGAWVAEPPELVLRRLHDDLVAYTRGHLGDDAAAVAIRRGPY